MNRQAVRDSDRRIVGWFDLDKATAIESDTWTRHDGEVLSVASMWGTETLYVTAESERWVLHRAFEAGYNEWLPVSEEDAQRWLAGNAPASIAEHFPLTPGERWFDLVAKEDDPLHADV